MFKSIPSIVIIVLALAIATPAAYQPAAPMGNNPPVADAGPDQTVKVDDVVLFDGSGSYDPDGFIEVSANILVNDKAGSDFQTPPSIGLDSGGNIFVTWEDYRNGSYDILFGRKMYGAANFEPNIMVSDIAGSSKQSRPCLAVGPSDDIHIVWEDNREKNWDIYYANSTDGGASFGTNVKITNVNTSDYQNNPSVDVDASGVVHVVWEDNREKNWSVYYANSADLFATNVKVNEDLLPGNQWNPSVKVGDNGVIHVVWDGSSDIFHARSMDGGASFGPSTKVNDDATNTTQAAASLAVESGGILHLVWEDKRIDSGDVFYSRSLDDGLSFEPNIKINDDLTIEGQTAPAVAVEDGEFVHVVWGDPRLGTLDIFYSVSYDGGASFQSNEKISDDIYKMGQRRPDIAAQTGGYFHAVWKDARNNPPGQLHDVFYAEGRVSRLYFDWDFGDGSPIENGMKTSHVYTTAGTYLVTLTVTDEQGASGNDTATIIVEEDQQVPVEIDVDIDPDTLNLKSKAKWITVYIEVTGADPRDIDPHTVLLNGTLSPENNTKYGFVTNESSYIMDHDEDGKEERMFKFDRATVQAMVSPAENVILTVTFEFTDGTAHQGSDTIRVIGPPK